MNAMMNAACSAGLPCGVPGGGPAIEDASQSHTHMCDQRNARSSSALPLSVSLHLQPGASRRPLWGAWALAFALAFPFAPDRGPCAP